LTQVHCIILKSAQVHWTNSMSAQICQINSMWLQVLHIVRSLQILKECIPCHNQFILKWATK